MPKFSIITVVYNNVTQIEGCISSVLSQKYRNFEYIIIDGGSTDGTIEIINKYRDDLALIISEPDNGITDAFNKGLANAQGEIIGILNSDDWLEPTCLEDIVSCDTGADILYGLLRQIRQKSITILDADHNLLTRHMTLNHPSTFVRRSTYNRLGLFNLHFKIAMDYEFLLRCYVSGASFKRIPNILANMRLEGKSEKEWVSAIREVKKAKEMHLGASLSHHIYFVYQLVLIPVSRLTRHPSLMPIKALYTRLSGIKRTEIVHNS